MRLLKKKTQKTQKFQLFIFDKPAFLQKYFHDDYYPSVKFPWTGTLA